MEVGEVRVQVQRPFNPPQMFFVLTLTREPVMNVND